MKRIGLILTVFSLFMCACGSGDTGEGYSSGDGTGLNPHAGALDSSVAAEAGVYSTQAGTDTGGNVTDTTTMQ